MNLWVTSAEHYGHGKVIEHCGRPFSDLEHMREALIYRHNQLVAPGDIVWHLGDFSFAKPAESMLILARLHGIHHLVLGNHDRSATAMRAVGFRSVQYSAAFGVGWATVKMRHLPPRCDDGRVFEPKFHDDVESGAHLVLCGHSHEKWRVQEGTPTVVNVGVDVWDFRPANVAELVQNYAR
jgi:calcineurin-like phosphoesterase family protein